MDETVADRIRSSYEAMDRGDFDAVLETLDPDVEWHDPPEMPDRRPPIHGREALKKVWMEYFEPFVDVHFKTGEIRESDERSFVALTLSAKGKASGAPVEMTWYQVGTLDPDGTIVRLDNYLDLDRALEAGGFA